MWIIFGGIIPIINEIDFSATTGIHMPFYSFSEMDKVRAEANPLRESQTLAGEMMKGGIVTYQKGHHGSTPHIHPAEEELAIIFGGRLYFVLADEERIIGPGDITLIPRNTKHGSISLGEKVVKFVVKSPIGDGNVSQDVQVLENAEEILREYGKETGTDCPRLELEPRTYGLKVQRRKNRLLPKTLIKAKVGTFLEIPQNRSLA
ncbi:MAG: cupin domain-containing protein [Nitrospinota bacterium]|nr:cupin domain-containing protein [Nitrospinota bacterium]MDP7503945.1 cupin domain-containing protein [Nitrospinota bacterium]